jgi:hypothetical protein
MPIYFRSDYPAGDENDLEVSEADDNWKARYGTPTLVQIIGGVLTINGTGVYRVQTQTGITDEVTSVAGAWRVGDEVTLLNQTVGDTITYQHQANLHLAGLDFTADTIYSVLVLKCVLMSPMTWVELHRSNNS